MSQEQPNEGVSPANSLPIIGAALGFGATSFAVLAVILPRVLAADGDSEPRAGDAELIQLLSLVHIPLLIGNLAGAVILPGRLASRARENGHDDNPLLPSLFRWALLEGASLFGIVIVLLAGLHGILPAQPLYYANLISLVIFLAFLVSDLTSNPDGPRDDRP